ncbi:MAG: sigma-54 dependent transcriptional regulator [Nitrospirota bacterium]|nr:sigma-54 dependent transcriptional regulator [Nitrospirota bacterium]
MEKLLSTTDLQATEKPGKTKEVSFRDDPEFLLSLTCSGQMRRVLTVLDQVANTDATVLILGESGVGKGLIAAAFHARSLRRDKHFIKVNCAALPTELLESELFGYEKGAFTGAHRRKLGKFELAHQGTIFLDEVGDLSFPLQAKLLQVLQDGEFSRLGGVRDIRVDARLLASTNRDLEQAVAAGTFRVDLYYRLNVVTMVVPALRERPEDILPLANYFLRYYADMYHRPMPTLSGASWQRFQTYPWPGNVRELENVVKRIVVFGNEAVVEDLKSPLPQNGAPKPVQPALLGLKEVARRAAREAERLAIQAALEHTHWNRVQTAKLLQISYKALLYKIQECGLLSSKQEGLDGKNGLRSTP